MNNSEYKKDEDITEDETGFSEKQLDIDAEIQAGVGWHQSQARRENA